jgi:molybdate transport system substrate-binding protein
MSASAATIQVMSSIATREAYNQIVPRFEKSSGHKVVTIWAGTSDMMKRIGGGEVVDLAIVSAATIDELTRQGRLVAGSRTDVAKSGIAVAVRPGAARIDLSSGETVKKALLAANSIAYSSGPSGVYLADLFRKWGIADEIKSKVTVIAPGLPVGDLLARSEVEIGFQQVSELLAIKGIDYLGPLPPDIQIVTVFAAALHVQASAPDAAKALVKFLTSPESVQTIKKAGLEPG